MRNLHYKKMLKKKYTEERRVENKKKHIQRGFHEGMKKWSPEREKELFDKIRLKKRVRYR